MSVRVLGSPKELAKLGDALINFIASAALTVSQGYPVGLKVPDKLLRDVAKRAGINRRGSMKSEDLFEALVAYAWLKGVSTEEMLKFVLKGLREGDLGDGLYSLLEHLLETAGDLFEAVQQV